MVDVAAVWDNLTIPVERIKRRGKVRYRTSVPYLVRVSLAGKQG